MKAIYDQLREHPIVYVTRDIERALGLPLEAEGYFIISNATDFAKKTAGGLDNVLLIAAEKLLDTHDLLTREETKAWLTRLPEPRVLVFKNTPLIERICALAGWRLLNPSAELAAKVEEKISQVEWLSELVSFLPPHQITAPRHLAWREEPFILQFNRAHTGLGTELIESEARLAELRAKFPDRPTRVTKYIAGPIFTSNNVVAESGIIPSNVSYQITGLAPFTDSPFATVGNDWSLANKIFTGRDELIKQYVKMTIEIGEKLRQAGWRGLFGLDFVLEEKTGRLYLIEINARQPAGATYESWLQQPLADESNVWTTFALHLASLLGVNTALASLAAITDGAQIVLRHQAGRRLTDDQMAIVSSQLENHGCHVIWYENTAIGSERLRVQSQGGMMSAHNLLGEAGQMIADTLNQIL